MSITPKKIGIIFFGSFNLAIETAEKFVVLDDYEIVAVVTNPDRPVGRKKNLGVSPVKAKALSLGLKILQPEKLRGNQQFFDELKDLNPDLGVVVGYSKILPREVLDIPRLGILNIHPSLLPKYRGPSPGQAVILNGESKTGVTVMKVDEQIDHGPILVQSELEIHPEDTAMTLLKKLFALGTDLLIDILPKYISGDLTPVEQDHSQATFSKMLWTQEGEIFPSDSIEQALNKIRALNPEPGTFVNMGVRMKILNAEGSTEESTRWPSIKLLDGYLLLKTVQPAGKKVMSGEDWLRGQK